MSDLSPGAIGYKLRQHAIEVDKANAARARRKEELEVWRRAYETALGTGEQDSLRLRACADSALRSFRQTRDSLSGPYVQLVEVTAFLRDGAETLRAGGADASATIYDEIAELIEQHWSVRDAPVTG